MLKSETPLKFRYTYIDQDKKSGRISWLDVTVFYNPCSRKLMRYRHLAYKNWRKVADLIFMHYFKLILASTERSHNLSTFFFDNVLSHLLTVDILNPGPTVYILDRSVIAIVDNEASMF